MYFNFSWTEVSFIDMMTNSLLETWNLVWTRRQTKQATTKDLPSGEGGGGTPRKIEWGVWPASQNPYPIYDQNLQNSLPYLWPAP